MISIKKIIDVSTGIAPATQGRRNFARAIVIQKGDGYTDTVRSYSSADEVLQDLGSNSEAYKAALKYFAGGFNNLKPNQFYVGLVNTTGLTDSIHGKFTSGNVSGNLATLQAVDDGTLNVSIDGSSIVNVAAIDLTEATTLADVAAILQDKIRQANTAFRQVNVTYNAPNFVIESSSYGNSSTVAITAGTGGTNLLGATFLNGGSSTAGTTGTLDSIISGFLNDNRYYHIILSNDWTDAEILQWSSSIEASTKITYFLWALSTAANIANQSLAADTSTVARTLYDRKANKTALIFDLTNIDYKQASLPSYFGIVDFTGARPLGALAFKQFASVSPTDLTNSQFDNLMSKNVNFYSVYGEVGRNIAYPGKSSAGNFINDVIAADWIDYNMTYNIFDLMVTLPRLGYTRTDFAKLYQAIERAYLAAFGAGIIAGGTDPDTGENYLNGYSISIPRPENVPEIDKQQGIIQDITTIGLLRGSAIKFVITNTLKL